MRAFEERGRWLSATADWLLSIRGGEADVVGVAIDVLRGPVGSGGNVQAPLTQYRIVRINCATASASWWSPTCFPKTCRLKTCITWPATPTPGPPRSMTDIRVGFTRNIVERISV